MRDQRQLSAGRRVRVVSGTAIHRDWAPVSVVALSVICGCIVFRYYKAFMTETVTTFTELALGAVIGNM